MMNIKTDNIDANTVMLLGAVLGVIFIAWQAKKAVTGVTGSIGDFYNEVTTGVKNAVVSTYQNNFSLSTPSITVYDKLSAMGLTPSDYQLYTGKDVPAGALYIQAGDLSGYYVKKKNLNPISSILNGSVFSL